jgi:hypothetical protein
LEVFRVAGSLDAGSGEDLGCEIPLPHLQGIHAHAGTFEMRGGNMKKILILLTLSSSLAFAQERATPTDPNDAARTGRVNEARTASDYGWIGLFGLAGLLGLTRRSRADRLDSDRVHSIDRDRIEPGNIRRAG